MKRHPGRLTLGQRVGLSFLPLQEIRNCSFFCPQLPSLSPRLATEALANGSHIDPYTFMKTAGHTNISMSLKYVHPDQKLVTQAMDNLAERFDVIRAELAIAARKTPTVGSGVIDGEVNSGGKSLIVQ